ncbi:flagellar filament capping protein FliD [Candidatus Poribacteria bacterium]|nr:flagellar filament capping protein FliD [Candidatus Poribacteria bacterium]
MASGISFSGLFSGIDWNTMIDQLMTVERKRETLLANKQTEYSNKVDAWNDLDSQLGTLKDKVDILRKATAFNSFSFSSNTSTTEPALSGSASSDASAGNHTLKINQLAKALKLSSKEYTENDTALNLSGEIVINNEAIIIDTNDTLIDIKDTINLANLGVTADIVSANSTDYRLIITSDTEGDDGFTIFDASTTDVLQSLGITSSSVSINNPIANGAESIRYTSKTSVIQSLLGLNTGNSGTVNINGENVAIDLSNDTLEDIAASIDAVAGVTASVEEETEDDTTYYYLKIQGTTNFTDDNNILETLGVLIGDRSNVNEIQDGSVTNTTDGSTAITAAATWANVFGSNVAVNDTITFTGKKHNGDAVSGSLTIDNTAHTVQELLTEIETAFNNEVTASIVDGKIQITDETSGDSYLSLTITENNEGGGSLDFGTVSASTKGRKREIQTGNNSSFEIDGIPMSKDSNTVTDVLTGVTLNFLKESSSTTIDFKVAKNISGIKSKIADFVNQYNSIIEYINTQYTWDAEKEEGGILMGDGTLFNVHSQVRNIISSQVSGLASDYVTYLSEIGIASDNTGELSIDDSKLTSMLNNDFDNVKKIFIGDGTTSDSDISFVSYGLDSIAGNYDINITTAAEQASITGSTAISGGGITSDENLTITDIYSDRVANIALSSGDTLSTIISKINTELQTSIAEVRTGSVINTTDGATPITATTTWAQIFGANADADDTINISGTDHNGKSVSGVLTIDDTSHQVQELLDKIESVFSSQVTASINADGELVITDRTKGDSGISLTLTENNQGGGSLNFGTIDLTTEGRGVIEATASDSGGKLNIIHNSYGSAIGLKIVSDIPDLADGNSTGVGTTLITDYGVDVAGTINGESCTGKGQALTGDDGEDHIDSISIKVKLTAAQLLAQGNAQGTIKLTLGVADQMYSLLNKITDKTEGYVSLHVDSLQTTIDDYQEQIDNMERRLEKEKERLIAKFSAMENALAMIDSQKKFLNSQFSS